MKKPELSIIIITLNEEKNLPKLLKSIKSQNYKNYEIIVSDAGSKDKTQSIAKKQGCRIVAGGLPGKGRNNGARAAKGKYLLFLDSDVILPDNFLGNIMGQVNRGDIDIATVNHVPLSDKDIDRFLHKAYNLWQKSMEKLDPHAVGVCIIIRRGLFMKTRGFDEKIKLAEDHALARKAFRKGAKYKVLDEEILVSTRRLNKEGRLGLSIKYILAACHRALIGEIKHDLFKYQFGHK